jgi:serine/threonine protein kinase
MSNYEIGSRVGDYEVIEVLGAGGMGCVYKVRNVISDRVEAMKVLLPNLEGDPDLADRFMREIKVQASLEHANIAALHTALRIDNQFLMLMEYVEGTTIEALLRSGPIPLEKAVDYMVQVLSALSYAHARGVVHRDLKPANMIVTPGGVVKLMDFGIAKMTADQKLTRTGCTVGSLFYMSPEQIRGALDLDPRSDLYSLGVSLYEMVTGARPFQGDSEFSIMTAHLQQNPPPPIQVVPNLPPALSDLILMSLEKDPARRFQTAAAFRTALLGVAHPPQGGAAAPTPAPPASGTPSPALSVAPKPVLAAPSAEAAAPRSRRGMYMALGALLAIAVLIGAATQIPKFRRASAENAPAKSETSSAPAPAVPSAPAVETQPALSVPASPPPSVGSPARSPAGQRQAPVSSSAVSVLPPVRAGSAPVSGVVQPQTPPQAVAQQAPPAQPVQPAPAAASDNANSAELEKLQEQLNLLGIRAGTCKTGVDNLRRVQASSGLGLRADIAESAQRMDYYLNATGSALQRKDAAAGKKNLDSAEREVSKIEAFLGR